MKIQKNYLQKPKQDPHLHSPAHVLADDLSNKLGDRKHFGFYLKMALTVDHNVLRKFAGDILEKSSKNPGALFAYMIKKHNREKNSSTGYSIWLFPELETRIKIDNTIKSLGAAYNSVAFPSHLTILSEIPSIADSRKNFNELGKFSYFKAASGKIEMEDLYFKSFYLEIEKTSELSKFRRQTKKLFFPDSKEKFEPHISLLYGNFKPTDKPEMLRRIITTFPRDILFTEAVLVDTNGTPANWKVLDSIKLNTNDFENR
ncbi:MAG: hypothetical protein KW793_00445 [Candidatus Doudnabacteria bacterium]|nr:hypothetical protein [Candidatus Doudnabacteria bacterium]